MLDVMSKRDKWIYRLFVLVWLVVNGVFWSWWFREEHLASAGMFVLMSLALLYETTLLPSVYLFYVGRMRKPIHQEPPPGLKVAMITLCVPQKESLEVIERQLKAMSEVEYSHDSWVLDEGNDPHVKALAVKYGVEHFSRKGMEKYNQPCPPFQAKTKAGNVNAWIDAYGDQYDFFVQMDIDHNPRPDYLNRVLGHFTDPKVAWVQAPSIYGNLDQWTARGSAEQELVLQGPLQMGFYGWSKTPFIIGSHSTYRMSAIRGIGGFQPTRAEDHLDTVVLARHGHEGTFVPEPIAIGDGPETFDIYLAQQFAWAYSMIQVFFKYLPKYVSGYKKRQALQFLFAQTWYTFWSTSMAVLFLLPCVAILLGEPIAKMPFGEFAVRYTPVWATAMSIWLWTRKWFQPKGLSLSWRGVILHVARWPIVLLALFNVILGIKKPYMITSKGKTFGEHRMLSLVSQIPYLVLLVFSFLTIWIFILRKEQGSTQGYLLFVLEGILLFIAVYGAVLLNDLRSLRSEGVKTMKGFSMRVKHITVLAVLGISLLGTSMVAAAPIAQAISWSPLPVVPLPQSLREQQAASVPTPTPTVEWYQVLGYPSVRWRSTRPTPTPMSRSDVALGVYDPEGTLNELALQIQHTYVVWFLTDDLTKAVEEARQMKRFPLISLEPWPLLINNLSGETLLADINSGKYDEYVVKLAKNARAQAPQKILIRWAHEMELTGLYPWSQGNPEAYISAYRRVYNIFKALAVTNVLWIWSPGGNADAEMYYPGDNYVDYIGVTILADERWDEDAGFDNLRSFETLLGEKYRLSEEFNKPLIAAEVGVSTEGNSEKLLWLSEARRSFSLFPQLGAFVYFNAPNTHAPTDGYRPDWTVNSATLKEVFLE